jgi:putative effector of murein hydrolase
MLPAFRKSDYGGLSSITTVQHRRTTTTRLHASRIPKVPLAFPNKSDRTALLSAAAFVVLDVIFRLIFTKFHLTFPSSLGACSCLFAFLLTFHQNEWNALDYLKPGATLLAKWLPVFFVPSLVTLPLADSIGSAVEVFKVGLVLTGGFVLSLLSTSLSVLAVRKIKGTVSTKAEDAVSDVASSAFKVVGDVKPVKPFSDEIFNFLCLLTLGSGVGVLMTAYPPLMSLFLLSTTLTSFVFGTRLSPDFTKVVHPLVTCTTLTWAVIAGFSLLLRRNFHSMLHVYTRGGGLRGLHSGAGDILLFLLGPAVVSLAVSMYERRKLMKENLAEVGTAIGVSTVGGLFGTAMAVRVLDIMSPYLRLSLLSRNITSPLAMAIARILGADASLAVSMVVVTGLIGANFGASILDAFKIKDGVARGLGIGAAAHGLGTAAFANEKDAFPFAAIAMALTATAATVTVSIPILRKILLQLALGA